MTIKILIKMPESSLNRMKTLWEKEILLITRTINNGKEYPFPPAPPASCHEIAS